MQVKVTNKVIILKQEKIGTNNVNTIECEFDLCEEFEGLTPIAVFTVSGTTYKENIIENKCMIPHEVLENEVIVEFGVYGFEVNGEELIRRYSPVSTYFAVEKGSYKEGEESVDATPNNFEYYLTACTNAKTNAETARANAETAEQNAQASAESASASAINAETIVSAERQISDNKYAWALEGNAEGQIINLNDLQEGTDIKDYKIYGNAVQDGTPTSEIPVEIQSVGDLVTEGEHAGKYKVPVVVSGNNEFDEDNEITTNIYLDRPLYKLEDADYIDFCEGKRINKIKEKIFNGTETWYDYGGTNDFFGVVTYISDDAIVYNTGLCNYFIKDIASVYNKNGVGIWFSNQSGNGLIRITVPKTIATTVAEFKAWVAGLNEAGNPLKIIYQLENKTEETTIELPSLTTFANTTIIEVDTTIIVSNIKIKYNKDINKAFNDLQSQILALAGGE